MSLESFILLVLFVVTFAIPAFSFAPWVPTRRRDIKRALGLARVKEGEILYDCGSGDGRVVLLASELHKVRAIGIELSPLLFFVSQIRKLFSSNRLARFELKNLYERDLQDADIVFLFGTTETIGQKLKPKLEKELKPGTRVVSYVFPIEGWKPVKISKENPREDLSIFLYIMGKENSNKNS